MSQRKRPWYLVAGLVGALALGTAGAIQGWGTFVLYNEPIDISLVGRGIADAGDRGAVQSRFEQYLQALDVARPRKWPLGVASLLLGSAVFIFASRALGGRASARPILLQLLVAQAGVNAASYWILRDLAQADLRVREAIDAANARQVPEDRRAYYLRTAESMRHIYYPAAVTLDALTSAFIIIALTRKRSREFYESSGHPLPDEP